MRNGYQTQEVVTAAARMGRRLLLAILLLLAAPAWGAGGVLVIGDTSRSYINAFSASLTATLNRTGITVSVVDSAKYDAKKFDRTRYNCIVTVGNDAARRFLPEAAPVPVLHALITDSYARELSTTNSQTPRIFLLIDQPIRRLVLLAKAAMPIRTKLGVIYGPNSVQFRNELNHLAFAEEMSLIEREIDNPAALGSAVSYITTNADLLLTLPDPVVVNEGSAKTLILGAYMGNLPLLGYSQALVKAGALMAVHSTPEQLGRQGGELIGSTFWEDPNLKEALLHPRYYQVSVNYQVARALRIELPSEDELKGRLEKLEMAR